VPHRSHPLAFEGATKVVEGRAGEMHYPDEKPVAATAIVVAVVLGVGTLVRLISSTYEPNLDHRYQGTSATLLAMAGK